MLSTQVPFGRTTKSCRLRNASLNTATNFSDIGQCNISRSCYFYCNSFWEWPVNDVSLTSYNRQKRDKMPAFNLSQSSTLRRRNSEKNSNVPNQELNLCPSDDKLWWRWVGGTREKIREKVGIKLNTFRLLVRMEMTRENSEKVWELRFKRGLECFFRFLFFTNSITKQV